MHSLGGSREESVLLSFPEFKVYLCSWLVVHFIQIQSKKCQIEPYVPLFWFCFQPHIIFSNPPASLV
jgi:hypothetical protein